MQSRSYTALLAWILCGATTAAAVGATIFDLNTRQSGDSLTLLDLAAPLLPLAFSVVGALILSRQPQQLIGLLMLLPGLSLFSVVDVYLWPYILGLKSIPQPVTFPFFLMVWFSNWNWLLLVFPVMFIMVLFPTGRPLSHRWGWLNYVGLGLMAVIVLASTFGQPLTVGSGAADWSIINPIGFLSEDTLNSNLWAFFIALPLWVILCVASLFVRFRHARPGERQQIKWLFYAMVLFTVSYLPTFLVGDFSETQRILSNLWLFGMLTIPIAIAIAILRYQLYDIDIIIRRTLVYSVVTALLALVYFGLVVVLQSVFESLSGQQSPLVIVISTLVIAALFSPLRSRIQTIIDRRFFRQKYDAQQVLAQFAQTARDEVSLEALKAELLRVVQETVEPAPLLLWLPRTDSRPK